MRARAIERRAIDDDEWRARTSARETCALAIGVCTPTSRRVCTHSSTNHDPYTPHVRSRCG